MVLIVGDSAAQTIESTGDRADAEPATHCRFVPERSDDFAWENDRVAFRTYGPALAKGNENSGIDCWAKRVPYPIIDKWYRLALQQKQSYHQDRGEGADFYHVGSSRGCGGTAIWHDGQMVLSNVFTEWKILECEAERSAFELTYRYDLNGRAITEVKTISIEMGQQLFRSESVFTENGKPADLEIAIGLTTHDQRGTAKLDTQYRWIAVWEDHGRKNGELWTGVVVGPGADVTLREVASDQPDKSHAFALCHTDAEGRTVHYAGFAWSKAGKITTPEAWHGYLTDFADNLNAQNHPPRR